MQQQPSAPRPMAQTAAMVAGVLLIVTAPVVALLPGPFGTLQFAAGLVLVLRNSRHARRHFALWKRRWPRLGGLADRALRRRSAARRRLRAQTAPPVPAPR